MERNAFEKIAKTNDNNKLKEKDEMQQATLEGVVKLLLSNETNNQILQRLQIQFNNYQQTINRQQSMMSDILTMVSNLNGAIVELKRQQEELNNKIENMDVNIRNIKIYKTVNQL